MLLLTYLLIIFKCVYTKLNDYRAIDLSDILNADYMPGTLLVLENLEEDEIFKNNTVPLHQGTFNGALLTMNYHRTMMNEYLCRNYVSEQILSEMKSPRIRRRLGNPAEDNKSQVTKINFSMKNNLLDDEGSTNYKTWLKKSATLEDIYRHYENADDKIESSIKSRDGDDSDEPNEDYDGQITGFGYQQPHANSPSKLGHSGTGIGYSYHGIPNGNIMHSGGGGGLYGGGSGHSGYGNGGAYFAHPDHMTFEGITGHSGHGGTHDHSPKYYGHSDDKDKLADLFDIALTAIAFLSFGMFIVQVIMCISMTGTTTVPGMTMMPMSMSPTGPEPTGGGMTGGGMTGDGNNVGDGDGGMTTGAGAGGDGGVGGTGNDGGNDGSNDGGGNGDGATAGGGDGTTGEDDGAGRVVEGTGTGTGGTATGDGRDDTAFRSRRDIPIVMQPQHEELNELARRVLISIEAVLVANQDNGNCLHKTLCENNMYSRNLQSDQKYWLPTWSLGMSWLSGRIIKDIPSSTTMLDSLKSALLGLGKADCEMIYHSCDLGKERQKRRRRRKRSTHK